jgi:hypothetical protein
MRVRVKRGEVSAVVPKNMCPRQPQTEICGYGAYKERPGCNLPRLHKGPHMIIEPSEVNANLPRTLLHSNTVQVSFEDDSIPETMSDVLAAWKLCGNRPMTSLEAGLEVFSKGVQFENKVDNLDAVRALVFLGYMVKIEPDARESFPVARYKLSDKGLKAASASDRGIESAMSVAATGKETKYLPKPRRGRVSPPEKTETRTPKVESKPVSEDCGRCDGTGVLDNGKVCPTCKGEGTIIVKYGVEKKEGKGTASIFVGGNGRGVEKRIDIVDTKKGKTNVQTRKFRVKRG